MNEFQNQIAMSTFLTTLDGTKKQQHLSLSETCNALGVTPALVKSFGFIGLHCSMIRHRSGFGRRSKAMDALQRLEMESYFKPSMCII
jgi:hypothetical protein